MIVTLCFTISLYFQGICFIRTSRPDTAVIYSPDEKFEVGVAKVKKLFHDNHLELGENKYVLMVVMQNTLNANQC